jgi:hypothetical protein
MNLSEYKGGGDELFYVTDGFEVPVEEALEISRAAKGRIVVRRRTYRSTDAAGEGLRLGTFGVVRDRHNIGSSRLRLLGGVHAAA